MTMSTQTACQQAARMAPLWAVASTQLKNKVLHAMADALDTHQECILAANALDCEAFRGTHSVLDRLRLSPARMQAMATGVRQVAHLPDPIGEVTAGWTRPNGLRIMQQRVPLGVIGIIYEARPNVTSDAMALCLKTGNAVVLRGSSTAQHTNAAVVSVMTTAGEAAGMPAGVVHGLSDTSREGVKTFVTMTDYLDLMIPRGGADLIRTVVTHATVPCIETGVGNCHIFVDESAPFEMAYRIIENAKTQRPSVCNAVETVLVHEAIAPVFLPLLVGRLQALGVTCRGCDRVRDAVPHVDPATPEDWDTEYLDLILALRVVPDLKGACEHIRCHGTRHSEAIITTSLPNAHYFTTHVDAAVVLVNASTRFVDGEAFGLGAEIGISTQKMHARGPMGLVALTSTKYVVMGDGQCRE